MNLTIQQTFYFSGRMDTANIASQTIIGIWQLTQQWYADRTLTLILTPYISTINKQHVLFFEAIVFSFRFPKICFTTS